MVIVKNQGELAPQMITSKVKLGMKQYTLAFDVQVVNEEMDAKYSWSEATFGIGIPTYSEIVSAIIRSRYDDDRMQAIINNHLMADEDVEHETEWAEMQQWRTQAKAKAKEILLELEK